jgi:predicted cobalt transporter CbtA
MRVTSLDSPATRPIVRSSTAGVLGAAVLAGLIAGAITSAFHFVLAEPVIERAIEQEKQTKIAHSANAEAPIVSRTVQRSGLVIGLLIYGTVWGALFGVAYLLLESRRQLWDPRVRGWLLAIVVGWAVAWFPFLKYPANPPGVGESATVGHRQLLYVGFIVLSAAGAAMACFVHARGVPGGARSVVILYVVYAVALYLAMPANPDPVRMPTALVWTFRAISLAGLVVFWLALGTSFQWLARARA